MPDLNNYQPMYSDPVGNRRVAGAPIIGNVEKPKDPPPDFNSLPYPPQVRGHYVESDGKQYVSVVQHDGRTGWIPVGATLDTNWKIEGIDSTKNQARLSAFGVPVMVDIGYGVPTGNVDRPYKIVDTNNYTAEFQKFTPSQHDLFLSKLKMQGLADDPSNEIFNPKGLVIGSGTASPFEQEFFKTFQEQLHNSLRENQIKENKAMGYSFDPDMISNIKSNYESAGNSSENVLSLDDFQKGMMDGTIEYGKDYLIPRMDENGEVDFETYNAIDPQSSNQQNTE